MMMPETMKRSIILRISVVIALIGFIDALYLLYSAQANLYRCLIDMGMFDCSAVSTHEKSLFLGVHVSLWGVLFYIAIILLLFLSIFQQNKYWLSFFLPLASLWGAVFSIYLTIVEFVIIKNLCEFCLLSAICSITLCVLILIAKTKSFPRIYSDLDFWNMFKKDDS
ncbi:MAG: hypothetical protein H7641_05115 [Candidatus Heimdallarchaeota archaeon]|nr:hypothetical protein [Candidatus Heimdallarchaeota archaeon]MCK4876941.1 hypothetical protein [Candidatus Heimdallarchaeota archaeon]